MGRAREPRSPMPPFSPRAQIDGSPPTEGWVGKGIFTGILLHGQYEDPSGAGIPWRSQRPPDKDTALEMVYAEDAKANIFKFYAEDQGHQIDVSYVPSFQKNGATGPRVSKINGKGAKYANPNDSIDDEKPVDEGSSSKNSKTCVVS